MINVIAIFIGGGIGSVCRYIISMLSRNYIQTFPWATLGINILGSFILGFVATLFWMKSDMNHTLKLAITIGFCGGLTTFSTFSFETFELIKHGEYIISIIYVLSSISLCLFAVTLGAFLARYV